MLWKIHLANVERNILKLGVRRNNLVALYLENQTYDFPEINLS